MERRLKKSKLIIITTAYGGHDVATCSLPPGKRIIIHAAADFKGSRGLVRLNSRPRPDFDQV